MKNKIVIIANGTVNNLDFHKKLLENVDVIICADGGAYTAKQMNIVPDYIIGDLDSTSASTLEYFRNLNTKIINDDAQDKTDLELALSLAGTLEPIEIIILGAIGDRIDHTLANILCLANLKSNIKARIIDEKNTIELIDKSTEIVGDKDDIVSIVPLTDISGLTYTGMKWLVSNEDTRIGWFGISNRLSETNASVGLKDGKLLVIRVNES